MLIDKNNRSSLRFPTFCTVEIEDETGITSDLSTTGFRFTMARAIPLDSMLRCVILMKKSGKTIRLRCEGQVVRVTKNADSSDWDIAIKFTSFEW